MKLITNQLRNIRILMDNINHSKLQNQSLRQPILPEWQRITHNLSFNITNIIILENTKPVGIIVNTQPSLTNPMRIQADHSEYHLADRISTQNRRHNLAKRI